ncbi:hypothetical protein [Bradyrhizobium sp.]|uniref:hypothetical protein n=1 Tax=Bradyrhizobium sp. TaxID=376 RepID=UPI0039E65C1C
MRQVPTIDDIRALDRERRREAFKTLRYEERRALALGHCGNEDAAFPEPLARYLEVDRTGDVSFDYAGAVGALRFRLEHICSLLRPALTGRRSKDRARAVRDASSFAETAQAEHEMVSLQWSAHLDAIRARRELRDRAEAGAHSAGPELVPAPLEVQS